MPQRKPSLFISHKHSDRLIADVLRNFVSKWSLNTVSVYQSSSAAANGPELGRTLTDELKRALWETSAVVLIYTTEDQDWSWCMWECGVATKPDSPDTRTLVVQCSKNEPTVFADQVRCNARSKEDIAKFARAFLTNPEFFPGYGQAVAPQVTDKLVDEATSELFEALRGVIPEVEQPERLIFANLRLELSAADIAALAADPGAVASKARVVMLDQRLERIFGIGAAGNELTLAEFFERWKAQRPQSSGDWLDDICDQIRRAIAGEAPSLQWNFLRESTGSELFVPILNRVRPLSATRAVQFDIQLLPYDELAATSVKARMVPRAEMHVFDLAQQPLAEWNLLSVVKICDEQKVSRIPCVDAAGCIRYIVHRSMIDRFLVSAATKGENMLTLKFADLFANAPELKLMFEAGFAVVDIEARLSEAQAAMAKASDCQDVFVTANGERESPVLGWITNVIVANSRSLGR